MAPRRLGLLLTATVRTSVTVTSKRSSTAWRISVLCAPSSTRKVYWLCAWTSWKLFSEITGRHDDAADVVTERGHDFSSSSGGGLVGGLGARGLASASAAAVSSASAAGAASSATGASSATSASAATVSTASASASAAGAAFLARERFGLAGASSRSATALAGAGGADFGGGGLRRGLGRDGLDLELAARDALPDGALDQDRAGGDDVDRLELGAGEDVDALDVAQRARLDRVHVLDDHEQRTGRDALRGLAQVLEAALGGGGVPAGRVHERGRAALDVCPQGRAERLLADLAVDLAAVASAAWGRRRCHRRSRCGDARRARTGAAGALLAPRLGATAAHLDRASACEWVPARRAASSAITVSWMRCCLIGCSAIAGASAALPTARPSASRTGRVVTTRASRSRCR